ncbi:hypothetical protein [Devosia rhizoryzae]|uniref:DUF1127 domain-containing protein n=1 Tax=Devosia rhizoryzae TaxID=2774137 RepID=A0ABX7C1Z2_9HYPH|nr:hypothetical protein [Devosia rhizoryzae]QQR38242.1 hypothetical protein JI748_10645 [Devosia rhizoryzae]
MSSNVLSEASVVLRLEFSIADAVRQRGLVPVMFAAIGAWWAQKPARYSEVPASLRADVGLDPAAVPAHWTGVDLHTFRLQPPGRRSP